MVAYFGRPRTARRPSPRARPRAWPPRRRRCRRPARAPRTQGGRRTRRWSGRGSDGRLGLHRAIEGLRRPERRRGAAGTAWPHAAERGGRNGAGAVPAHPPRDRRGPPRREGLRPARACGGQAAAARPRRPGRSTVQRRDEGGRSARPGSRRLDLEERPRSGDDRVGRGLLADAASRVPEADWLPR